MRVLKWFFRFFILIVLALFWLIGFGLNSETFLNKAVSLGIKESGLDIRYKSIKGGLYSGLKIRGLEYEDKLKADLDIDLDIKAIKDGHLVVNELNISNLMIDKKFLAELIDADSSDKKETKTSSSPIKDIDIKKLHLDLNNLAYREYEIYDLRVDVKDLTSDLKESHNGDIKIIANSNVAEINSNIKLKGKDYTFDMDADIKKEYLSSFIKDQNITLRNLPHIKAKANGDLNDVNYELLLSGGNIEVDKIVIKPTFIRADGKYGIKSKDVKTLLKLDIDSSIADLKLDADVKLNLDDLNNTLIFKTSSKIMASKDIIKDENLTIISMPEILLDINGDLKLIKVTSTLNGGKIRYNDIEIEPKDLDIKADYLMSKKDVIVDVNSFWVSNIADINLKAEANLNLDDLNSTLKYSAVSKIEAKKGFISSKLKDSNITLSKLSPFILNLKGDAKELDGDFNLDGEFGFDELVANPEVKNSNIHFDIVSKDLISNLNINLHTNRGVFDLKSKSNLNLDDINNTLKYDVIMNISDTKAFKGVDLSTLGDINLDAKGSLKELKALLRSDKIKADINSSDFDNFSLNFKTKKIYLSKIYKDIPADLNKSFVALRGEGRYIKSKNSLHLRSKLDGFRYNNHTITTNEFIFDKNGDDITLSPMTIRAGDFKLTTSIKKEGENLVAKVKNRAVNLDAKFRLDPLYINADGEIKSIDKLLKEVSKVYPVDSSLKIDGRVKFRARTNDDSITATIVSPKINLEDARFEKVNIKAIYKPNKIVIKNLDFNMRGFDDKSMNKEVRLARDGIVTFDDENASVDIELKNLVHFKGEKKGDVITGELNSHKLTLAHPEYGKVTLTSDIKMYQSGKKSAITGSIEFKDTEVNYESRYLDVSKDGDIIIVNKKIKKSDDFKNNTFLDLKIFSDDNILYKVRAGEIELRPNIIVRKDFGSTPKITGKIKIIDGEYDLADKRFKIKEGAVAFRGLEDINPLLDLHVEYDELEEILIMINIAGDKERPKLKFSSKPQKSKKDIFSYLLFGMSASESEGAMSSANKAAERIFGRAISKDLARELNLDRLDLNRNNLGGIDVKAGKKVGKKTIVYYQNKSTESSVIVERKLSKDWDMTIEAGKVGQGVDFVYRRGFK